MSERKGNERETCPACGNPAKNLVAGVCPKCRTRFEAEHSQKMIVEWKPSDFEMRSFRETLQNAGPLNGHVIMDDQDAVRSEVHQKSIETMDFFKRGYRLLCFYRGNFHLAKMAFALAMGWGEMIECETAVDVAVKLFKNPKKKAAVTKVVKLFQDALAVPPMPGQRSEKGRKGMTAARNGQLK